MFGALSKFCLWFSILSTVVSLNSFVVFLLFNSLSYWFVLFSSRLVDLRSWIILFKYELSCSRECILTSLLLVMIYFYSFSFRDDSVTSFSYFSRSLMSSVFVSSSYLSRIILSSFVFVNYFVIYFIFLSKKWLVLSFSINNRLSNSTFCYSSFIFFTNSLNLFSL